MEDEPRESPAEGEERGLEVPAAGGSCTKRSWTQNSGRVHQPPAEDRRNVDCGPATRPLYKACEEGKRRRGTSAQRQWWWEQSMGLETGEKLLAAQVAWDPVLRWEQRASAPARTGGRDAWW